MKARHARPIVIGPFLSLMALIALCALLGLMAGGEEPTTVHLKAGDGAKYYEGV